ncbi:hypothetical protein SAMN05192533_12526 [Mesobacillus persicus]|uniref:Uncharacterized protein n=1 Tax=Mesobacillus persicus TaxID=930146 RepID=A0A1H8K7W5_9BACI|nr:hypothetical protein [Mesobacillus persicus]SEN89092.1 hypothetical protein SAMN05192533_12526 [Mesobacillus persicus]
MDKINLPTKHQTRDIEKKPNKNGIIKRRKTSEFAQIQNQVLQDLTDIRSIGLIAHLMSMPANWEIRKTHLYSKFGRGPISSGITELEEKKYWVEIVYRVGSQFVHDYHLSDVAFTDEEVSDMVNIIREANFPIRSISAPFIHLVPSTTASKKEESETQASTVDFQQSNSYSTNSTVENQQLLNKERQRKRKQINKDKRNIVNLQQEPPFLEDEVFRQALTSTCQDYYPQYAPGRWSKQAWQTLIETFVEETLNDGKYRSVPSDKIPSYARAAILNMVHAFDRKSGRKSIHMIIPERPVPFYDWVSEGVNGKRLEISE